MKKSSDATADRTDLKLARYPRSLAPKAFGALPSVSLFPAARLADENPEDLRMND
jgi:hypothetical protein